MSDTRALADHLVGRLDRRTAEVAVCGQGYVGLSLACGLADAGLTVRGYDVDEDRVARLTAGELVVPGVPEETFAAGQATGRLTFSTDLSRSGDADVVVICVPTPVVEHRPDLSFVEAAATAVAPALRPGALVVLESTTYPGTTEQVVRPLLERHGRLVGRDLLLAYSPERIDPGNVKYGLRNTPRVVGGVDDPSTHAATRFYATVVDDVVAVSGPRTAEMAKLLENTFRMVNIALVNELATLCAEQDIDVWEVIRAAASKPFGFMPFQPGPGVGGHCIPLDPTYLAWQSRRDTGRPFRLVETAQDLNAMMPRYVADRIVMALSDRGVPLRGARLLVLGVTYKPDVGDLRESAALHVVERLLRGGADVSFHDPFVSTVDVAGHTLHRVEAGPDTVAAADMVVLLTPHATYDVGLLCDRSRVLFDARNATGSTCRAPSVVRL
ncbi:MAG: nucleotide sugar dehydrogenase [Actinomycetes bacterium]